MSFSNFLIILFRIFRESDYNFGDVVLVGFPFTGLQTVKKRPAVVISRKTYQQNWPDVISMAVTSRIRQPLATGEAMLKDWQVAGLARPSVLKPLIATLAQKRIVKVMGRLSVADMAVLDVLIQTIFGKLTARMRFPAPDSTAP
uniref:mRNA interferase MazF n=1 Tax=Candidatus Kentrum sp. UNK TaxID=2126344 RepID=A0A451AKT7_9GAMM|nr:MAG: mRNA interferase MazF [Candidatus Kentron sp. UNK]VFK72125.1 MAG: mRNA interferase MazF [Candidatus Kentron sp. UNK]